MPSLWIALHICWVESEDQESYISCVASHVQPQEQCHDSVCDVMANVGIFCPDATEKGEPQVSRLLIDL